MVTNQDYSSTYTDSTAVFPALGNDKVAKYEKEILQAKADGFDGFAMNCGGWLNESGNNHYYIWYSEQIFQACANLNNGFKLMFSCDTCCGNGVNDAEDMVRRFANDPTWGQVYFKYNNKVVLSFFDGSTIGPSGMNQIRSDLANGTNPIPAPSGYSASSTAPLNVFLVPSPFLGGEVPQLSALQSQWPSWSAAVDGGFYWGIAGVPGSGGTPSQPNLDQIIASENWASVVHGTNQLYMAPVCFHFWGANAGRYYDYSGYEGYRKYWMDAINVSHPDWVEVITWNDFMEGSYVSPMDDPMNYPLATFLVGSGVNTWRSTTGPPLGYWHSHVGVSDLTPFYIQWYKTGVEPTINYDQIFWTYRTQTTSTNVGTPNIGTVYGPYADKIYVTCNLAAPATLTVNSGGTITTVNVPAGSNDVEVPAAVGSAPTFTLTRNGQTVLSGTGDSGITTNPVFNDNSTTVGLGDGQPHTSSYNDLYMDTGDTPAVPYNQPPTTPTNFTAAGAPAGGAVNLSWTASYGSTPLTYTIYRGTTSGGETQIASGVSATTYTDSGLTNGTTYYYYVKGVNALGTSPASTEASATPVAPTLPSAPSGVTATGSDGGVSLSWNASGSGTQPITYNVLRGTSSGSETSIKTGLTGTTFTDTGLASGTTYYYKIQASNIAGTSNSAEVNAKTLTVVYQIDTGSASAVAPYAADEFFDVGTEYSAGSQTIGTTNVYNPAPMAVYDTVRWNASFNYTIPNLTAGSSYLVRLHFVEESFTAAGSRQFNVAINGSTVLTNFDVFATAGGQYVATEKDFTATANSSGQIVIAFSKGAADNPDVAGIEIYGGASATQTPPSAPTLSGSAGNATVALSWTSSTGTAPITYSVYRGTTAGGEGSTPIASGLTGTTYTDSSVSNGTAYYYKVTASNSAGSATSNEAGPLTPQATPPTAPTLNSATAGSTTVALAWTSVTGASSYNVYRGTSAGGESTTPVAANISGTTYTDSGLTNGATYYYKVAAVNTGGTSPLSNEKSATPQLSAPAAPTLNTPTPGNATVALTWSQPTGASTYNVYRGTSAGGESGTAIATGLTSASYTDTGLTNGTTYYYMVAAVNAGGTSPLSNEQSATPTNGTVDVLDIACGNSAQSPYVADTDFSGGTVSGGTSHAIDTSAVGNPAPTAVYQHGRYGNYTYTIPNLTAGSSYTVRLHFCEYVHTATGQRVFNVSINGTQVLTNFDILAAAGAEYKANVQSFTTTANSSGQIVITTQSITDNAIISGIQIQSSGSGGTAPSAPSLTVTGGNAVNTLSWTSSTGTAPITYNVYRGTTSGGEGSTAVATNVTSPYTDSGLTNGTKYYYIVKAVNSIGATSSNEASGTPVSGVPAAPTGLTATAGTAKITLGWTASSGATSYNIYRGTSAGGEGSTAIGTSTTNSYTDSTTTDGTQYYYTVKAVNSSGTSGASNEANAVSGAIVSGIDLIVTSLTWTPASPVAGSQMVFTATVKNQGQTATPSGTIVGVGFYVDSAGGATTWNDKDTTSLGPGQSVTLTATGSPTSGVNYWTATSGSHTVKAWVDDVNRISESNENNNTLTSSFSVP